MGLFENARRPATDPADCTLTLSLPPNPPKKKSTQKMSPHQIFHHQCDNPGIDPIVKSPSVNPVYRTHAKDSYPKPARDHTLTPSRTRVIRESIYILLNSHFTSYNTQKIRESRLTIICTHTTSVLPEFRKLGCKPDSRVN
jgi:hypothetical protein